MKRNRDKGLLMIALFKLFKGASLIVLAFGFLKLLHRDAAEVFEGFVNTITSTQTIATSVRSSQN